MSTAGVGEGAGLDAQERLAIRSQGHHGGAAPQIESLLKDLAQALGVGATASQPQFFSTNENAEPPGPQLDPMLRQLRNFARTNPEALLRALEQVPGLTAALQGALAQQERPDPG